MSNLYTFNPIFKINQEVYHITPYSDKGIIVDINYCVRTKQISYNVLFGRSIEDNIWCHEYELSENKVFV